MPLSVIDLYREILPKTNCGDCGFKSCLAFASMVVSEKHPIQNCPHLSPETVEKCQCELKKQYAEGKWLKKDMALDAVEWARSRATSTNLEELAKRTGGELVGINSGKALRLPYFTDHLLITTENITKSNGEELPKWHQVFIYNHLAQAGNALPSGNWRGFVELPNTVSKLKSMKEKVEEPIAQRFKGKTERLVKAAESIGGKNMTETIETADLAILFRPLPRVPVLLIFRDEAAEDHFEAEARLLFDETVTDHLDIESILFLSETIKERLC